jgi:hypothetical protein
MFSYEAISTLWHNQSLAFMDLVERDGVKFLKFYWDFVESRVQPEDRVNWKGLDYEVRALDDGRRVVLITMPPPMVEPEAYFLALVEPPVKKSFFPWQNFAYLFALEFDDSSSGPETTASFSEWTKRGSRHPMLRGMKINKEVFYYEVLKSVMKAK